MFDKLTSGKALPSLNALRAFEAMGRTGSATLAAAELNVTHSAVSRQVKALEAALGLRLFEGPRNQLKLTTRGRTLLTGLTAGFDAVADAVRSIRTADEVHLAVHPSLAVKWLVPRLPTFEAEHPDIHLHLSELEPRAMRQRGADIAIRFVDADDLDRSGVEVLARNRIGLVCTPRVAEQLETASRLTTRTRESAWGEWVALAGRTAPSGPERALAHLHMTLDAAMAGLGAAVLPHCIAHDALAAGRLIAPHGFVEDRGALVAIRLTRDPTRSERRVLRWLRELAVETR